MSPTDDTRRGLPGPREQDSGVTERAAPADATGARDTVDGPEDRLTVDTAPDGEAVVATADTDNDPGEFSDDEPEPEPRRTVTMGRGAFLAMVLGGLLVIVMLGATTVSLALRDPDDQVVATVNGEKIRRGEYDRATARSAGQQVLDTLVLERLIDAEARKRNIVVDANRTEQLFAAQRARFESDEEFQAALEQSGLTEADLRQQLRLREILRQMVADQTAVTDQEISERYEATKARYQGQTLDQVREQVRRSLVQEKENLAIPDLIEQLRSQAKIETKLPGL